METNPLHSASCGLGWVLPIDRVSRTMYRVRWSHSIRHLVHERGSGPIPKSEYSLQIRDSSIPQNWANRMVLVG